MKISQKKILVLLAFAVICMLSLTAVSSASETIPSESDLLISDGVSVKMEDLETNAGTYVAIRFLFKWDAAATNDYAAANSLTPVKVGLVACSEAYYNAIEGDHSSKLVQLLEDNTSKVVKNDVAVYENGEMILKGKFLADGTDSAKGIYRYSYTLYNIPKANYDDEIYAATYILWSNDTYTLASLDYSVVADTSAPGEKTVAKNTISLYDTTLGLFKQGLINSEKAEEKYLWNVLMTKALEATADTADQRQGAIASSSGVYYYYLPDNIDGGFVLAYKYQDKSKSSILVKVGSNRAYARNKDRYRYSTNSIVVDYGITGLTVTTESVVVFGDSSVSTQVQTIVYPDNFTISTYGRSGFKNCGALKDVIWCHLGEDGNYVEHMSGITWAETVAEADRTSLWDLRGFGALNYGDQPSLIANCNSVKNIILHSECTAFSEFSGITAQPNVWASPATQTE